MKKKVVFGALAGLSVVVIACVVYLAVKSPSRPPKLRITAGNQACPYVVGLNQWNGSAVDREDNFRRMMKDTAVSDLPYAAAGETVSIAFESDAPDAVTLTGHLLNPDGTHKFSVEDTVEIDFGGGKGSFSLDESWAASFSSDSADAAPGALVRGFRLVCRWGDNECEYAFIVRSDPPVLFS